ncbi:MAG: FecR domain-containing protein [Candidatus Omnitrophica bacterium]|nr:FecR domain-containing protein [Candidatus Omnitrophota bacterium]
MAQSPAQPVPILAEPAASVAEPSAPLSQRQIQIGVAAAVHGNVQIASPGAVGVVAQSGRPIYLGDVVTTDGQSRLQVLLMDETVFTIGPNSSIVIDEFVYDPATADGKLSAEVLKGTFRFVTGKIAHKEPRNMKVTLPAGTIGVRGTMVAGRVDGDHSLVVLLGPGPENTVGARIGRIEVGNEVNSAVESVMITRPGHGTEIPGQNLPPTPPALMPPQVMQALQNDLSAPLGPPPDNSSSSHGHRPGAPPTDADGHPMMPPTGENMSQPPSPEMLQTMLDSGQITPEQFTEMTADMATWNSGDETTRAALMEKYDGQHEGEYQPPGEFTEYGDYQPDHYGDYTQMFDPNHQTYDPMYDPQYATFYDTYGDFNTVTDPDYYAYIDYLNNQTTTAAQTSTTIANGVATKAQLATVQTGKFQYVANGGFRQTMKDGVATNIPGQMNVTLLIDFGSRTIGGNSSNLEVSTTANGGNISATMGLGARSFDSGSGDLAIYQYTSGNLTGDLAIKNSGGVIGGAMDAKATFDGTLNKGEGTILDIPRTDAPQ